MGKTSDLSNKGSIDSSLLSILCCPDTKQQVTMADSQLIEEVNSGIEKGEILNRAGGQVKEKLDGGILREDKKVLYPIRDRIPIMLIEEAIVLN
ncbi:MAG: hypothetical protein MRJ96_04545 [Nitrospirales bacterium]|nr:hypothetical protein [Nitrospira sp.]MDR4500711.1 hypothetical protein [Nitrospirales bacterium]